MALLKLLIVDDEKGVCESIESFVLRAKVFDEIIFAHSGEEALLKYEQYKPDMVLLDIRMGEMNGLEVLRQIRQDKKDTQTQIIMVTQLTDQESQEKAKQLGAPLYISKPFDPAELRRVVIATAEDLKKKK